MRTSTVIACLLLLNGCQSFQLPPEHKVPAHAACDFNNDDFNISDQPCDILRWFDFRFATDELDWPARKKIIAELGNDDVDTLKKILLSQNMDTPYQSRLRAQNQLNDLIPILPEELTKLIRILLQQPTQKLLEYESALVTVGKINSRQSQTIEEQKVKLDTLENKVKEQHNQIEQLMKIETTLSNKDRQNDK
ncbi:hypothetical protein [Neptunicella sp. SCSIO 80796]|uniref:hypothetical protein n=1 Tax=Neptunicella plasticusilytica TaxID=3117012 RepID=UPI003A4E1511